MLNEVLPVHVKPGIERFLNLSAYDEKNAPLKGIIYEALINNSGIAVSNNSITLKGDVNSHQVLKLHADTYDVSLFTHLTSVNQATRLILNTKNASVPPKGTWGCMDVFT